MKRRRVRPSSQKMNMKKMRGKTTITEKNVHGSVLLFNKVFVVVHSCGTVTTQNSPPGEDQRIEK